MFTDGECDFGFKISLVTQMTITLQVEGNLKNTLKIQMRNVV